MLVQPQPRGIVGAVSRHFRAPVQASEQIPIQALAGSFPSSPRRIAFHTAQDAAQRRLEERLGTLQTRSYFWD